MPAQSPPEAVSALSQVNPSPGFECPSEFAVAELDPEGVSSSWQTVHLTRSAKGNRRPSRTPKRLSAKVASIVMPVPSVLTSSTSPVSSESSESSELPTYLQVESPLPSRVCGNTGSKVPIFLGTTTVHVICCAMIAALLLPAEVI